MVNTKIVGTIAVRNAKTIRTVSVGNAKIVGTIAVRNATTMKGGCGEKRRTSRRRNGGDSDSVLAVEEDCGTSMEGGKETKTGGGG